MDLMAADNGLVANNLNHVRSESQIFNMAMLAGPRRKQKVINLRAKNNAWSNDNTKFGQRMLEKMGWSSGKGLGAKENGIVEHVVAKYKNDERGLGFEDKNDQWTKHEDDFNALLANLSNAEGTEEKLHSGISLEVKSKKSKARVHYHKFTRGKDLTRYSEKDLANIFGKKSLKEEEKVEEPLQDDVQTTEQVFTEKGSMADYFKNKLANIKSKTNLFCQKNESDGNAEYAFKGFSTNLDDSDEYPQTHQGFGFSFYNSSKINESVHENDETNINKSPEIEEDSQKLKKKKKKKNKEKVDIAENNSILESTEFHDNVTKPEDIACIEETKLEKKVKKKKKSNEQSYDSEESEKVKNKKKRAKSNKNDEIFTDSAKECLKEESQEGAQQENYVPKKKKKRKNKGINE